MVLFTAKNLMIILYYIYWSTSYLAHFKCSEDSVQCGLRHAVKNYVKAVPRMWKSIIPTVFIDKTHICLCLFVHNNLIVNGVGHWVFMCCRLCFTIYKWTQAPDYDVGELHTVYPWTCGCSVLSSQQGVCHIIASEETFEEPQYTGVLHLEWNEGGAHFGLQHPI